MPKMTNLVALLTILVVQSVLCASNFKVENCGESYPETDIENEGCKTCVSEKFYLFVTNPQPTLLAHLSDDPPKKKQWTCISCPANSVSCEYKEGRVQVNSCVAAFFKYSSEGEGKKPLDEVCKACPVNSLICNYDYKETRVVVESCADKFYINPGKKPATQTRFALGGDIPDDSCQSCPSNALKCHVSDDGSIVIDSCDSRFYLKKASKDQKDQCVACPINSTSCTYNQETNKVTVDECDVKFYLKEGKGIESDSCLACPVHSKGCRLNEQGKLIVDGCDDFFYLVNPMSTADQSCAACPDNGCVMCNSSTTCNMDKGCKPRYFKFGNQCKPCITSCNSCEDSQTCKECDPGFGFIDSKCSKCIENCKLCKNTQGCETCNSGFFVDLDSTCEVCSKKFNFCSVCTETECTSCIEGHELKGNFCSKQPLFKKWYFWAFFLALFGCFGMAACCMNIAKISNRERDGYMESYDSDAY